MPTMSPPRAHLIQHRLDRHFQVDVGVAVATPEPTWWWERWEQYGKLAILGWTTPIPNVNFPEDPDASPIIAPYCPQIIDEQTFDLDEQELANYLDILEWVCDTYIGIHWQVGTGGDPTDDLESTLLHLAIDYPDAHRALEEMLDRAHVKYGMTS